MLVYVGWFFSVYFSDLFVSCYLGKVYFCCLCDVCFYVGYGFFFVCLLVVVKKSGCIFKRYLNCWLFNVVNKVN